MAASDILSVDTVIPAGQHYVLISVVPPPPDSDLRQVAIKIRGVFANVPEAEAHVKKLERVDGNNVDIFLGEVGKWMMVPPDPATIEDHHYMNSQLEKVMTAYTTAQAMAAEEFHARKQEMLDEAVKAGARVGPSPSAPPGL